MVGSYDKFEESNCFDIPCWFILSIQNLCVKLRIASSSSCVCAFSHSMTRNIIPNYPGTTQPSPPDLGPPPLSQIYMAECSSKSDEYGRDDGGNTYPSLHAMLVCTNLSLLSVGRFWMFGGFGKIWMECWKALFFCGGGGKDLRHNHFHLLVVCGYFCWCKKLHRFLQIHLNFVFFFKKCLPFFQQCFILSTSLGFLTKASALLAHPLWQIPREIMYLGNMKCCSSAELCWPEGCHKRW